MTNQLAEKLTDLIESTWTQFESIPSDQWGLKSNPKKWSKKEVLGHLIDSGLNNIHRFIRIKQGDQTNIYYNQDFWVEAGNYQNQDLETIKILWRSINLQIATVWKNISDEDLNKTIPVKKELPTLQFLMEDYMDHMNHHLKQIF